MLTASLVPPHPALSDFIQNYTLCVSTSPNVNISFPLYAHHDTSIGFFLGNTSVHIKNHTTNKVIPSVSRYFLFGLSTHCKEAMTSTGDYKTFTIEFKPNGFNRIFGIAASEIRDNIFPANEVIGKEVERFHDQLLHAASAQEMVGFSDRFLLDSLNRKKTTYSNDGITKISSQLLSKSNTAKISQYAYYANMSIRNFERRFGEQVGTSPKLFCRLLRFNSALNFKIRKPTTNWTDLANKFGYHDNMHLIKEFKKFTNTSPAILLNSNPDFVENGCYKIHSF